MQAGSSKSTVHWSRKPIVPNSDDGSESDASTDVTEDEEGTDLTPALDAAILRTLGKIRRGEGVYEGEKVLETELEQATAEALRRGVTIRHGPTQAKPYLLADHHRSALLEGRVDEEAEEEENRWRPMPYAQEQRRLRKEAIEAFHADDEAGEDEGFVAVKKDKEGASGDKEDEGYRQFLLEMGGGEEEVRRLLGMGDQAVSFVRADAEEEDDEDKAEGEDAAVAAPKKEEKEKRVKKMMEKKAKDDDEFLMNFILNRGWVDKADGGDHNYADMALDPPRPSMQAKADEEEEGDEEESQAGPSHPWGLLDEDEFDDKADEFETGYNFRFEEPGAAEITSHPRIIPSLVRRPDDARKLKRAARAERKAQADLAREEEARKTKGKKRREMDIQLAALRKEVGEKEWKKVEEVLEGEYDEALWERVVGGLLSGQMDDGGDDDDNEKPTWEDDDEDMQYGEEGEEEEREVEAAAEEMDDGPINMDADFIGLEPEPRKKSKKDKKGKNKQSEQKVEEDDGLTVEERAQKLKEAMKEYKALDHEDMIGDLPTRFHYTQAAPQAYGLSPAEILLATDSELNQIMSVKHLAPYRNQGLGAAGKGMGQRVRSLKDQLKERRWGEEFVPKREETGGRERDGGWPKRGAAEGGEAGPRKKRKGKNERKKMMAVNGESGGGGEDNTGHGGGARESKVEVSAPVVPEGNGEQVEAPKKRRKKNKHGAASAQAA